MVERLTRPFSRFLRIETAAGAVLLASTLVALILSNSRWADAFLGLWETHIGFQIGSGEVARSVKEWINDGLMTLFFFLVALELKRELVLGELGHPRVAALSIAAALGGMLASPVTAAVIGGFVIGKPVGVLAFSWLAVRSGIAIRQPDLRWRLVAGGGLLAGIGFTMALFIANLAFSAELIDEAKLGIFVASVVSAAAGLGLLATSPRALEPTPQP